MSKAGRQANRAKDIDRRLLAFGAESPVEAPGEPTAATPALSRADRRRSKRQGSAMVLRRALAEFTEGKPDNALGDKSTARMLADAQRLLAVRQRRLGYKGSAAKTTITPETAATVARLTTRNPIDHHQQRTQT